MTDPTLWTTLRVFIGFEKQIVDDVGGKRNLDVCVARQQYSNAVNYDDDNNSDVCGLTCVRVYVSTCVYMPNRCIPIPVIGRTPQWLHFINVQVSVLYPSSADDVALRWHETPKATLVYETWRQFHQTRLWLQFHLLPGWDIIHRYYCPDNHFYG